MFWAHLSEPSLFFTLVRAQLPLPPICHTPPHTPPSFVFLGSALVPLLSETIARGDHREANT